MNRVLAFGGASVHLEHTSGRAADLIEFLFGRIPHSPGGRDAQAALGLAEDASGTFTVSDAGQICCVDSSAGAVASWLLHIACLRLARAGTDGLLLHGGAVSWGGRGLLLPGVTGSGKSTLTAFLTTRGFKYLTDELAYVPAGTTAVQGLSAPFKIKKSGLAVVQERILTPMKPAILTGHFDVLVDPGDARCATGALPLSAIAFPRYHPGSEFRLRALSPAHVGLRLLAGVLNAGALPDHGFREITRVANETAGYEMVFSSLEQIEAHLEVVQHVTSHAGVRSRVDGWETPTARHEASTR